MSRIEQGTIKAFLAAAAIAFALVAETGPASADAQNHAQRSEGRDRSSNPAGEALPSVTAAQKAE